MKNKAVIGVIIALVILIGGYGTYRVYKHFRRLAAAPQTVTPVSTPSALKSLKDLLGLGTAQKCTFDQGTVYVAGGKVRADLTAQTGTPGATHMITMANTSYIWMDGQTTGFKTSFDVNATPAASGQTQTAQSSGIDATKPMNYSCGAWSEDGTLFALPKAVTFTDMSTAIPSMPPTQAVPTSAPYIPQGY